MFFKKWLFSAPKIYYIFVGPSEKWKCRLLGQKIRTSNWRNQLLKPSARPFREQVACCLSMSKVNPTPNWLLGKCLSQMSTLSTLRSYVWVAFLYTENTNRRHIFQPALLLIPHKQGVLMSSPCWAQRQHNEVKSLQNWPDKRLSSSFHKYLLSTN